jgi:predicted amidophosphoribosyltransferase
MGEELSYVSARGAFRHTGLARRLVADFKFGGQPVLGRVMADVALPWFIAQVSSIGVPDRLVVTWVPCHRSVERERGYNQAEVLARVLAAGALLSPPTCLVRKAKATRHQKGLGRADRQENLRGAFTLDKRAAALAPGRTQALLVVDDVYATGATAREVSSVLGQGMGLPAHVFTFSRVVAATGEKHD